MPAPRITIRRLNPADASLIVACFKSVYGDTYANDLFYNSTALARKMEDERLFAVGAFRDTDLVGHMAMTITSASAASAELGNTVVDPSARGEGVAWQVGAELNQWCRSRGYRGFLHYPTTDHHIMQEHSVKAGFETGLMLGYIPAETDGKVLTQNSHLRQAATVVYQPLAPSQPISLYSPAEYRDLLVALAAPTGLDRIWLAPSPVSTSSPSQCTSTHMARRGLTRLTVTQCNSEFQNELERFLSSAAASPCIQVDLPMNNPHIDIAANALRRSGFYFCAWLPGYCDTDVLRLQRVHNPETQMIPGVVNPVAQRLLRHLTGELTADSDRPLG